MRPRWTSGLLERTIQRRDARLFVIAVEGEESGEEYRYFRALEERRIVDRYRVKLHILPADAQRHDSSPQSVLDRLLAFRDKYHARPDLDEHWLVLDVDTWKEHTLASICRGADRGSYHVAVSNPCFEVWLLCHAESDLAALGELAKPRRSEAAKRALGRVREASRLLLSAEALRAALGRAAVLDKPEALWPECPGTRVYRLIESLAQAGLLADEGRESPD